ncbi:MAG: hypothetical protein OER77_00495 [Myxococcales bacterium]|nr:hypothetical protein [Myxococcales bacterium]
MEADDSSRTLKRDRLNWVVQLALSSVCFVLWIIVAHHYSWSVIVVIAALSFLVGFFVVPTGLLLSKSKKGLVVALAAGALSAWALAAIDPDLLDGALVAIGGLWFSTSARGTLHALRA